MSGNNRMKQRTWAQWSLLANCKQDQRDDSDGYLRLSISVWIVQQFNNKHIRKALITRNSHHAKVTKEMNSTFLAQHEESKRCENITVTKPQTFKNFPTVTSAESTYLESSKGTKFNATWRIWANVSAAAVSKWCGPPVVICLACKLTGHRCALGRQAIQFGNHLCGTGKRLAASFRNPTSHMHRCGATCWL